MRIETKNKLDYLAETKALIKSALIEQGQAVADSDTFRSYADKIVAIPKGKEKYDGTVVITSNKLSGTWLIDSAKLYNLLLENRDNVSQSLNFSAGVKGSDAGLIYYDTMTFNFGTKALQYSGDSGTNSFSNYNYSAYGDGWKEYPDGDNGATINFNEEQAVSGNFYALFTSIATKESE